MSSIVIVESPTKAKTIRDFLPKGYEVYASMGHIRDLPQSAAEIPEKVKKEPWAQLGVNVDKDFEPLYVVPKDKKKVVTDLKKRLKDAKELILASDEDREGESIAWHLLEVLSPKIPVKRMVFHEITKEAIAKAVENCREIDQNLVRAQETRRILDRLVGYGLSPLLWKKVSTGLSAGRVQSVSIRLIVEKERERRAFKKGSYWDLRALVAKGKDEFEANLTALGGKKVATGKDFDEATGQITKGKDVLLIDEKQARSLESNLFSKAWKVTAVEEKPSIRKPSPPFITSTLQQEAARKLRLSPRKAMQVAQGLYERGFITYMRTDSVQLSDQALKAARKCVTDMYGSEYLTSSPRVFESKSKGAQEAHEAIRPAGAKFAPPAKTGLKGVELALYDLIWKRTVASQMKDAKQVHVAVDLQVDDATFTARGKRIEFPGFFRAYVEGSDDPDAALEDKEILLPPLKVGDKVEPRELEAKGHETKPPARYSEASLVKKLEAEGIGRPSTYATIIDTIQSRGYVNIQNHNLVPTFVAFAVVSLLENHFPDLVDVKFTAKMEQVLDDIAAGTAEWLPYMKKFFLGKAGLQVKIKSKEEEISPQQYRHLQFEDLTAKVCIGRFGPYLEMTQDGEVQTASIPVEITPAELTQEEVELILMQKNKGSEELGIHPKTHQPVYLLSGAYGPYVQLGDAVEDGPKPKRVTLPKNIKETEVDMQTAVALLNLPCTLGEHPEKGGAIKSGISRYGSYVVHEDLAGNKDFRTLPKEELITQVTLERALELINEPKKRGRKSAEALREVGPHPEDGAPVQIFNGPYGPYIKHNKTNASVPKDKDLESLTMAEAVELLAAKAAVGSTKRGRRKRF